MLLLPLLTAVSVALAPQAAPPLTSDSRVLYSDCKESDPTDPGVTIYTSRSVAAVSYHDLTAFAVVDDGQGNVTSAALRCWMTVNGQTVPDDVRGSGIGVVVAHGTVGYSAPAGASVQICYTIDFTGPDDTTPSYLRCADAGPL